MLLWARQSILWRGKKAQVFWTLPLKAVQSWQQQHTVSVRTRSFVRACRQPGSLALGDGPRAGTISDPFGRRVNGTEH